jgi:protein ImuA
MKHRRTLLDWPDAMVRQPGLFETGLPAGAPGRAAPAPKAPAEKVPPPVAPLHPALWRAHQLARPGAAVWPSGFAALDVQLPGGGWPRGALTELLLPHPGVGELRLLAPALAALQAAGRGLLWFDPPAVPCAEALQALGLNLQRLVLVRARDGLTGRARERLPAADLLWALEQALKSGHAGAVLAWLPARLPAEVLRRLQLAAQAHDGPAFLLRDAAAALQRSPAPLRLRLAAAGPDRLRVALLKRRGPPALQPLVLDLPPVLPEVVAQRWGARRQAAVALRRATGAAASAVGDAAAAVSDGSALAASGNAADPASARA